MINGMKNILKNVIYFFLSKVSFRGTVVLMYHSVGDNNEFFTVRPNEFERHMRYLKIGRFNVISLEQFMEILEKGLPVGRKTIVITFDDGYEDNYLNAYPILRKYDFPATIFVSTANIGKTVGAREGTELKVLDSEEIKEMQKSGLIYFGSHAHHHVKLHGLGEAEIDGEMVESKDSLEEILGEKIVSIAYPFGCVNKLVKNTARKYFKLGCGVQKGRVFNGGDIFNMKRNSVDSGVNFTQFKGIVRFGRI